MMGKEPEFGGLIIIRPRGNVGEPRRCSPPLRCPAGKFCGLLQGAGCSLAGCRAGGRLGLPFPGCPGSRGLRRAAPRGVAAGAPGDLSFPGDRPASSVPATPGAPRDRNPSLPPPCTTVLPPWPRFSSVLGSLVPSPRVLRGGEVQSVERW